MHHKSYEFQTYKAYILITILCVLYLSARNFEIGIIHTQYTYKFMIYIFIILMTCYITSNSSAPGGQAINNFCLNSISIKLDRNLIHCKLVKSIDHDQNLISSEGDQDTSAWQISGHPSMCFQSNGWRVRWAHTCMDGPENKFALCCFTDHYDFFHTLTVQLLCNV